MPNILRNEDLRPIGGILSRKLVQIRCEDSFRSGLPCRLSAASWFRVGFWPCPEIEPSANAALARPSEAFPIATFAGLSADLGDAAMGERRPVRPIGKRKAHRFVQELGAPPGSGMPNPPQATSSALARLPRAPGRPCRDVAGKRGDRRAGLVENGALGISRAGGLECMAETADVPRDLAAKPPLGHGDRCPVPATARPAALDGSVALLRQGFAQLAAKLGILKRVTQLGDTPGGDGGAERVCPSAHARHPRPRTSVSIRSGIGVVPIGWIRRF
jgi:hypothetical protein